MSDYFQLARHMPCPTCGASVDQQTDEEHVCADERKLEYEIFQEVKDFDAEVAEYFDSPGGRFEVWLAERERTSA